MSQSPVFQTMFKETYIEGQTKAVKIDGVDDRVMEELIKWLYLGEKDLNEICEKLFVVADRYQIMELKVSSFEYHRFSETILYFQKQCLQFMVNDIYFENIIKYLDFALEYNNDELKTAVIEFVSEMSSENISELFMSDEWAAFTVIYGDLAQEIHEKVEQESAMDTD
jgi:hypothetical protein